MPSKNRLWSSGSHLEIASCAGPSSILSRSEESPQDAFRFFFKFLRSISHWYWTPAYWRVPTYFVNAWKFLPWMRRPLTRRSCSSLLQWSYYLLQCLFTLVLHFSSALLVRFWRAAPHSSTISSAILSLLFAVAPQLRCTLKMGLSIINVIL